MSAVEELIETIRSSEDYFTILGVSREADEKDIIKAYRKLALKLHPDKCKLPEGEEAFKKVGTAFACLKDADKRAHYERFGSEANEVSMGGGVDPHDLFAQMFREMQTQQGGGMGGAPGGFTFHSTGPGFQSFTFSSGGFQPFTGNRRARRQAQREEDGNRNPFQVPKWLQVLFGIIPRQLLVPACLLGTFFVVTYGAMFIMKRIPYFLAVMYVVPSHLQFRAMAALVVLGICGAI